MDSINATDSFKTWKDKTNAVIEYVNDCALRDEVLLLSGNTQTVNSSVIFTNGIILGSGSGPSITRGDNGNIHLSTNLYAADDAYISTTDLRSRTGSLTLNGVNYAWPDEASDGIVTMTKRNNSSTYDIDIITNQQLANNIAELINENTGGSIETFTLTKGNGIRFNNNSTTATLGANGGNISLNVNLDHFKFSASGVLSVNASTPPEASTIVLRNSNGNIRSAPVPSNAGDDIVATVGYVQSQGHREFGYKALNGRGFNSYGVQPERGAVCIDVDDNVIVYGENGSDNYDRRFGYYSGNAYGHNLNPFSSGVQTVYADQTNTYLKLYTGQVYSLGRNVDKKAGVTPKVDDILKKPAAAFNGELVNEVILSYDRDARTMYALLQNGKLLTYGGDLYGQLGDAENNLINGYKIIKAWLIGGGNTQTGYALREDNTLWVCGYGAKGQLGRYLTTSYNDKWVPVLDPTEKTWASLGVTTSISKSGTTYTATFSNSSNVDNLRQYDRVKIGSSYYTVNVTATGTDTKSFQLHTTDEFTSPVDIAANTVSAGRVLTKMEDVVDAYFGGTGNNTFAFAHRKQINPQGVELLNILYGWGYNGYRQLGLGDNPSDVIFPRQIAVSNIASVYTGLDYSVHLVGNNGKLWGAGDNRYGTVGIPGSFPDGTTYHSVFRQFNTSDLSSTSLGNLSTYQVHKFFSSGNNTRFCLFKTLRSGSTSSFEYQLTAWGVNNDNQLGIGDDDAIQTKPKYVWIKNDSQTVDVQTTNINNSAVFTLISHKEPEMTYGNMYVSGKIYYNFNCHPNGEIIPYFTKVKKA